ncbi:LysR family transcriptional regulator [Acetonema longum]|uniref:LysR family transcriptional regulator n=1 Tax=Acetonema longum DSM 6540 TaxID=1009370 RepID=F7NFD6_9FIRM|nr:LysR family transcriptional regulator [Acetonema longum]EGO65261.1 LysR family transcriptional regulator [Acetonema longum DSM 6540]
MELRHLEYFKEVCRSGSFTKAASNLYVAQPVVTNAILKLEAELNVRLLHRSNKSVTLTNEGQLFLTRIESLLELADDIHKEMRDCNSHNSGSLRLGIPPQIGNRLFPYVFIHFNKRYPDLNLIVTEENSSCIISMVAKGELEVGIVVLPETPLENVQSQTLFQQQIVLCVGTGHPLRGRETVALSELRNEKFIMRKPGSLQRDIMIQRCQACGFTPNIIFSSSQIQTIRTLVAHNVGISFLMQMIVLDERKIRPISLKDPILLNIGVVWKKDKYISKAAQAFIDFVCTTWKPA